MSPRSTQNVTRSAPSSGSTVQLGGTTLHPSNDPVGAMVGCSVVGMGVGKVDGKAVGTLVGIIEGEDVGVIVGLNDGDEVGVPVVGAIVGENDGESVGDIEGASDGHSPHTPNSRACRTSSF